jgi:flagellar M-ring protein FliF
MLESVVGQGKAVVRVSADLDFKITEKTEEIYDPESPVVRSTQKQTDRSIGRAPAVGRDAAAANGSEKEKTDETVNYEINKTVSKTVMPVGDIQKLSIAVLVDGLYPKNDKGVAAYQERPKKELESLEDLVRKSAGFNPQRGDQVAVASMPFSRDDAEDDLAGSSWQDRLTAFFPLVKYGFLTVGLLLVFLLVVKPLLRTITTAAPTQVVVSEPQLSGPDVSVELSGSATAPPLSLEELDDRNMTEIDLAKHLAGNNSKKYAEVIRNWLK